MAYVSRHCVECALFKQLDENNGGCVRWDMLKKVYARICPNFRERPRPKGGEKDENLSQL